MSGRETPESMDRRDAEIARLRRELEVSRAREEVARARFSELGAMSRRFAQSMRARVSERQQYQRRIAAQYAVSDVLADAQDLAGAAPRVFEILGERLGWEVGALWTPDEEVGVMRRAWVWRRAGAPSGAFEEACETTSIRRGEGLPGRVWERGEPGWVEDIVEDEEVPARRVAATEDDLHGAFAFPVADGGGIVGVFELLHREALPPDEDLMGTAALVGNQIGQFVERRRAEEAVGVAAEQARFRADLADALRPLLAPSEIQAQAARFLGVHLRANRVMYADVEDDEDGDATFAVVEQGYASGVPPLTGRFGMADFGLAPTTPSRSDAVVVADVASEPGLTDDERARYTGASIGAWVGVPLIKAGRLVAALGVHQREPRAWTPQEVTLIEETAERTLAAVQRARAEEALRESEERLQLALDASAMGSFLYHVEEDRGEPDARMLDLFGLPEDGTLNLAEALARLIRPDDRAGYAEAVARATDPGGDGTLREEIRVRHPGGAERSVAVNGRVRFEDGRAVRMAGVAADVTERRQAEQALRKSEERFRALIGKGADMITISDRAGRAVYASPTTEQVSGYTPEEFVAMDPFGTIHPDDQARCEAALHRLVDEPGLSLDLRHRVRHKDGGWRWVEGTFTSLFHEPAIRGLVANVRDITARVRAEEALRESEERYRSLVTATSSIVWTAASDGECVVPMPSWEEFTGQSFEQYRGFNWLDAVHPDDRPPTGTWDDLDPEEAPLEVEFRLRRRDGEYRRVVFRAVPVVDGHGAVREWVGTMSDVEEKRRVEEANAYLATVVRSSGQAVIGLSPAGVIESWNPAAEQLYGYTPEEALGSSISLIVDPHRRAEQERVKDALRSGQAVGLETSRITKDGRWVAVLLNVSPVADASGRPVGFSATATDITDRRLVEEALRESEERYRTLFESIDEGFCTIEVIVDADGNPADYRFLETNPAFERMTGLEGAAGRTARELVPDLEEFWFEVYGAVALTGEPARFENRSEAMDRWFDVYATRVGGPGNRRVALVFEDISERKRAEEEREELRREAEYERARLEAILRQMPSGVLIFGRDGKVVLDNAEARRIYGRRLASLEECASVTTTYPDDEPTSPETSTVARSLQDGETVTNRELYVRRPDGTRRTISANSAPVRDEKGRIVAAVKTFEDITGLRKAQERLRESEARFRAAFEQVRVGLVQASLEGHVLVPNPGFCQIIGYTPEEARELHVRDFTHPDDYDADMAQARRVLEGEIPGYSMEKRYVRKDGSVIWVNLTSTVARGEDGEPMYALAIVEDIDERKRAQEALQASEQRLRTVVEGAPIVLGATDREGVFTLSVGRGHEALGVDPGEAVGRSIFEVFRDNPGIQEDALRALSGESFAAIREARGGVWESSYAPLWDEEGEVAGIIAVALDVTERSLAEAERDRSQQAEIAALVEVEEARRQLAFYAGAREERQVISRELHDRVAHSMAVVRQHLELYEVMRERDKEAADAKLAFAKEEAKAALNNTRDLSMMLRHSEIEEGLKNALSGLLETTIPDGVRFEVEVNGDESLVPTHVGNQLFLILREAIRNATSHSGCEWLSVGLEITPHRVEGRVEDDGEGFEPQAGDDGNGLRRGGGMRSMKERTALVGGRFDATSRPGGGTRIEVSIPLDGRPWGERG